MQNNLDTLCSTAWEIHNFNRESHSLGTVEPLSQERREQIEDILNHVEKASLPNGSIEMECVYPVFEAYKAGEITSDESYARVIDSVDEMVHKTWEDCLS